MNDIKQLRYDIIQLLLTQDVLASEAVELAKPIFQWITGEPDPSQPLCSDDKE